MSFSLTRKTDYALVALTHLAEQAEIGGPPISARQIAGEYGLPQALLMNLLKELNRRGLVESRRGAGGGYYLARPADRICLAEVVEAIEGPVAVALCCCEEPTPLTPTNNGHGACRVKEHCPTTGTMKRLNDLVVGFLQRTTLADVVADDLQLSLHIARPRREAAGRGSHERQVVLEVM